MLPHLSLGEFAPEQGLVLEEILRHVLGSNALLEARLELLVRPVVVLQPLEVLRQRNTVPLAIPLRIKKKRKEKKRSDGAEKTYFDGLTPRGGGGSKSSDLRSTRCPCVSRNDYGSRGRGFR